MADALNEKELALCDEQGFLFERSTELSLNSPTFIRRFMNSALALSLDSEEDDVYAFSLKELYAIVNASYSPIQAGFAGKHYPKEVLYWIGYLYRYFALYRYRSSKSLYRLYPSNVLFSAYESYHTMDPKTAIENLEEDYLSLHPEAKEKEAAYAPISAELSRLRTASEANRLAIDYLLKNKK
jgi:hypothetical protein